MLLLGWASPLAAQARIDTLVGRVLLPEGGAVAGAVVRAGAAGDTVWVVTRTDSTGAFRLLVPGGARTYVVSVRRLGITPLTTSLVAGAQERRIARDLRVQPSAQRLAPLAVSGDRTRLGSGSLASAPGSRDQIQLALGNDQLPVDAGDLAALAALTPGVVATGDSGAISIGGLPPGQSGVLLDGAARDGTTLPREAVAASSVTSGTYDPARGRFAGGQLSATTRRGGDRWQGAAQLSEGPHSLAGGPPDWRAPRTASTWIDAGGGGPLRAGRLFVFGAARASDQTLRTATLGALSDDALLRLGVHPDSARRFDEVVRALGAAPSEESLDARQGGPRLRLLSGLVRLDYVPSTRWALVLRADGQQVRATGDAPLLAVPAARPEQRQWGGGGFAQLTARTGRALHELRAYASQGHARAGGGTPLPTGVVRLRSAIGDTIGLAQLYLGGTPAARGSVAWRSRELSHAVDLPLGDARHRLKLGMSWNEDAAAVTFDANGQGTFVFTALDDLAAGRPALYTRSLAAREGEVRARQWSAFARDLWQPSPAVSVTYGVRVERSEYPTRLAFGAAVDSVAPRATQRLPAELSVSPRVGVTWELQRGGLTLGSLKGGVGSFRGVLPVRALAAAAAERGDPARGRALLCIGEAAPAPEWTVYAADPARIPARCATDASLFASGLPTATIYGAELRAPRTWHGSLDWQWNGRVLWLGSGLVAAYGVHQPTAIDRNLDLRARFTTTGEAPRPVYVPPDAIDPATGEPSLAASRRVPSLGVVRELRADGRFTATQLSLRASTFHLGPTANVVVTAWYAQTHARATAGALPGLGGAGAVAGDVTQLDWASADHDLRHAVNVAVTWRHRRQPYVQLALIGRATSGRPYSPLVAGDVNGDGVRNDLASVPALTGDTALTRGMRQLLAATTADTRRCLEAQLSRVAGRNSCRTPWTSGLDAQLTFQPVGRTLGAGMTVSLLASNLLAGADQLLHGSRGMYGWGQPAVPDPRLLYTRGFDPQQLRFRYDVNPAFGVPAGSRRPVTIPFTLALQVRLRLGGEPAAQSLDRLVEAARAAGRDSATVRELVAARVLNVPRQVLRADDVVGLQLLPAQVVALQAAADSLAPAVGQATDGLAQAIAASIRDGGDADARRELQVWSEAVREIVRRGQLATRRALRDEQWARLPAALRDQLPDLDALRGRQTGITLSP